MRPILAALAGLTATACAGRSPAPVPSPSATPFWFEVVDAATGRGVPLVELETVHGVVFVTDSAGIAVIDEPGWSGCELWFGVRSHGYELPADGFGFRGVRAVVAPGHSHRLELDRVNVAERLYRVTGADRYRDSRRIGRAVPLPAPPRPPLGAGGVLGQDSVMNAVYGGELYWFWGDTSRASYPLGNFAVSGAVSALPGRGGSDPDRGVALRYFVGDDGFSRPLCPIDGPGPVWIDGLVVLEDGGREVMVCHYARMQDLGTRLEHGLARWNDAAQRFDKLVELPLSSRLHPHGHPVRVPAGDGGLDWLHFGDAFPALRVRARLRDLADPAAYEAYTCLQPGARFDAAAPALHRDGDGALVWAWQAGTDPVTAVQWRELVAAGHVADGAGWMELRDAATGAAVTAHRGHVCWNAHRGRWVMLCTELHGRSPLGEVWYAEARALRGPWGPAVRVVTHDDYSFYNVRQHPALAGADGRLVYFEGTYTKAFSGTQRGTQRYDYNQIMYRLDLADPRLRPAFTP